VIAGFWFSANPPENRATPQPSVVASQPSKKADPDAEKRFEDCRAKLKKDTGMLSDLDWKKGLPPRVVVGKTFFKVDFKTKQGFADTVNCFLLGGSDAKFINFDLLDWRDEKVVASYSNGRLKMN